MPTYDTEDSFRQDYRRLRPDQRALFKRALRDFIRVLREWENEQRPGIPVFPAHLGVKPMVNQRTVIWEFRWAADGRCTWKYGGAQPGRIHVIWRRIGTHAIYEAP